MSAIDDKHAQLPWIGNPKDEGAGADEGALPDGRGRVRDFDNGSIYWSPETGPTRSTARSGTSGRSSDGSGAISGTR